MSKNEHQEYEEEPEAFSESFQDIVEVNYSEKTGILVINARSHPPMEFILDNPTVLQPEGVTVASLLNNEISPIKSIKIVYNSQNRNLDRIELYKVNVLGLIDCDKIKRNRN